MKHPNIGDCYYDAWRALEKKGGDKTRLVHGIVELDSGEFEGAQAGHAWIEYDKIIPLPGGSGHSIPLRMAKDDTFNIDIPAESYRMMAKCRYAVEYHVDEGRELLQAKETYGPWDEVIGLALHCREEDE